MAAPNSRAAAASSTGEVARLASSPPAAMTPTPISIVYLSPSRAAAYPAGTSMHMLPRPRSENTAAATAAPAPRWSAKSGRTSSTLPWQMDMKNDGRYTDHSSDRYIAHVLIAEVPVMRGRAERSADDHPMP